MLILLIALAGAETPPPPSPEVSGRVAQMLSSDDYPPDALKNHWEGKVVVDLRIDTSGQPRSCRVVTSSGHQSLDDATCNIMLKRARFRPALDSNGRPVEDTFRTPPILWQIADPEPEPVPEQPPQ